ncbi:MAG: hypothetical protein ACI936_004212 [Paraglaciecola sp.]
MIGLNFVLLLVRLECVTNKKSINPFVINQYLVRLIWVSKMNYIQIKQIRCIKQSERVINAYE